MAAIWFRPILTEENHHRHHHAICFDCVFVVRVFNYVVVDFFYIRQRGYVFLGVCLFVCLLAGLGKNYSTDFHKIQWKGGTWATEETVGFSR